MTDISFTTLKLMENPEKKAVIDAINALGRRVTAADVASKTGLPLHIANRVLNEVASETKGSLEVSTVGDIVYKFAPGFENAYVATGIKLFFETALKKTFEIGFFLLRISFGIMMIVTFLAILLLIIVAILVLSRIGGGDSGGDNGPGIDFSFFDFMILRDLLWWGTWSAPDVYVDYNQPHARKPQQQKGNFLFNVFSFLFGDGNPNRHLDERKWQMIAEVIHNNGGVLTAEQLAPYTGADPSNDTGVLPVLVRFHGKPEVTEGGNIVYTFPEMQVRGARPQFKSGKIMPFLDEYTWPFTTVDQGALVPVYALAGFNFFGSWWLAVYTAHIFPPSIFMFINILTVYGTAFVAVPLVRFLALQIMNKRIEDRNTKRQEYAKQLQHPSPELAKKLQEAASYRVRERTVSEQDLVYTTEKGNLEQEFGQALANFDQQLAQDKATHAPATPKRNLGTPVPAAPPPDDESHPPHILDNILHPEQDGIIYLDEPEPHPEKPKGNQRKNRSFDPSRSNLDQP